MMRPVLYGLGSALGFGIADAFAAVSTRRIGVLATMLVIQFVDVVALSLLLLTPVPGALRTTAGSTAAIIMTGVLGTLSFFLFYRALQFGPVAIVSPVFASSAAIPVRSVRRAPRRAVVPAGGDRRRPHASGVVLASAATNVDGEGRRALGGVPFALVACGC
jgi:uncharacterized membrane protein